MAIVKVLIGELDGQEFDAAEYRLLAVDVPFDNSTNGFTADDVQAAIEEAAASGGGVEERLISIRCIPGTDCFDQASLLIDSTINFLKMGTC